MRNLKGTYRLFSLIMAMLMFFTSASFAMDMHYCGEELKSVSFFGKAKTCHDLEGEFQTPMKNCPRHKEMVTEKKGCSEDKNCCSNETLCLQSFQDQLVLTKDIVVNVQLKQFIVAYATIFFIGELDIEQETVKFTRYKPPLIPRDIPVLNQNFLL